LGLQWFPNFKKQRSKETSKQAYSSMDRAMGGETSKISRIGKIDLENARPLETYMRVLR
jgi:hypothetical protein